jgi:hypothetical protein
MPEGAPAQWGAMGAVQRHPLLTEADAWATEHRDLLECCFERFQEAGEWPTLEQLQHDYEIKGRDEDVSRLAFAMPRPLGFVEQQRLVLLVRALSHIPDAAPLLEDWCAVLGLAYTKWRDDPSAQLTRADALQVLDGDPQRTRLASMLFLRERWPFGSGRGGIDDEWSQEITSAVRDARGARSPADIIEARDRTELPPLEPPPDGDPPSQRPPGPSPLKRAWRVVSENTLIATVIGGIVVLLIGAYLLHTNDRGSASPESQGAVARTGHLANSGKPSTTSGQTYSEQAGTGGARTFSKPAGAIEGSRVGANQRVLVSCKVYDPEPESVLPDGYWYRLASAPWSGRYYAPANSFWNGDIPGKKPYTHNTDFGVPNC